MPKSHQPPKNPNHTYNLTIRIPGTLKQQIHNHLTQNNQTLNQWLTSLIHNALHNNWTVPPPPAERNIPTHADQIRAYATGERLLGPCGDPWPCGAVEGCTVSGGVSFCDVCGLRVG